MPGRKQSAESEEAESPSTALLTATQLSPIQSTVVLLLDLTPSTLPRVILNFGGQEVKPAGIQSKSRLLPRNSGVPVKSISTSKSKSLSAVNLPTRLSVSLQVVLFNVIPNS